MDLINYKLQTPHCEEGFEFKYEHTIMNAYIPHRSLTISVLNLTTLHVLLHYLPQLEYLVDKFTNSLEEFSLFLTHYCNGEHDICFDGYRLATLCSRLSHLRSLHFGIQLQFIEPPSSQTLSDFIQAFRRPTWLNGPLVCIRVCVNYHQVFRLVQMFSLSYVFSNNTVYRTTDLIDILFNTSEAEKDISNNLPIALRSLWSGMEALCISLFEKQKIPTSFIHALQCPSSHTGFVYYLICLYVNSTELKHWFTNHRDNLYLNTFFRQIDHLYIDCSPISNINQHEEIMVPLLSFVIDKQRFRQLQCLRFDFIEKEQQVIDMKTGDEIVSIAEPPRIADIHRFVSENHLALWIQ
ncbi:unnamed protein product [Rotaria magnacalcarata]|nr:unnamed protein product [Rotaria magnacalcarata]